MENIDVCSLCNGNGYLAVSEAACSRCRGVGTILRNDIVTCKTCFGTGELTDIPCTDCLGTGLLQRKQTQVCSDCNGLGQRIIAEMLCDQCGGKGVVL